MPILGRSVIIHSLSMNLSALKKSFTYGVPGCLLRYSELSEVLKVIGNSHYNSSCSLHL